MDRRQISSNPSSLEPDRRASGETGESHISLSNLNEQFWTVTYRYEDAAHQWAVQATVSDAMPRHRELPVSKAAAVQLQTLEGSWLPLYK